MIFLGPVELSKLGRTLTHEHLSLDFHQFYVPPPEPLVNYLNKKILLNNVGYIKQYPYSSRYNLSFYDEDATRAVMEDVKIYKKHGGGTIVDNTCSGINRDLSFMKKISADSGVHVILGCGYYVEATQTPSTLKLTEEQMHDVMLTELTEGCIEDASLKAGFIGEVGSSWPMTGLVLQIQFGGHGYSHILTNVIPRMFSKGFTNQDIDAITLENPRTWLTWKNPQ
ncbi:phosphotriesterase-related protein [Fopius arisanus]|uniref:Phosphotriesterase-related protein n=1 Tax=Fopius arisanus TaxID=64838 RepID=A0A9R1T2S7_9HYME|nr:PREDICTED: phosphotriesterase-related protein [Fopius arisanus]